MTTWEPGFVKTTSRTNHSKKTIGHASKLCTTICRRTVHSTLITLANQKTSDLDLGQTVKVHAQTIMVSASSPSTTSRSRLHLTTSSSRQTTLTTQLSTHARITEPTYGTCRVRLKLTNLGATTCKASQWQPYLTLTSAWWSTLQSATFKDLSAHMQTLNHCQD